MKSVPALRLFACCALFGGGAATGYFFRSKGPPAATASGLSAPPGPAAVSSAGKPAATLAAAFDGTLESLIKLAKATRHYNRAQLQLHLTLQPLDARQIGALVTAFPWDPEMEHMKGVTYNTLLEQWAEKDAEAALRWAGDLPMPRKRYTRSQLLTSLAIADVDKALALARRITPAAERDTLLRELSGSVANLDPRRGLEMILTDGVRSFDKIPEAIRRWAEDDPEAAFAKARTLTLNQGRREALLSALAVWSNTDPAAAQAAAMALPEGQQRQDGLSSIFRTWAKSDPAAAHAAALKLSAGKERHEVLRAVINGWCLNDPAAAVQAAIELPKDGTSRDVLYDTYAAWAWRDPAAAAASALAQPLSKSRRAGVLSGIASSWAQTDPAAAMTWAKGLPAKEGGSQAINSIMNAYATADGPAAAAIWQTLTKEQRSANLSNLMYGWSASDPDAALQFARSLERSHERVSALASAVSTFDLEKPDKINAVLNELPAGQMRVDAIRTIFSHQSQRDSTLAVRWLRTLPENERTAALNGTYYSWNDSENADPQEMKALLESTPGLTDYWNVWSRTAGGLAATNPAEALDWAKGLESPAGRRESIKAVLQQWAWEDPAAALAAARALPDAEAQKDALPRILQTWAGRDPDAVLAWAETAGGTERETALLHASLARADNDPVASAAAVDRLLAAKNGENPGAALNGAASQVATAWFRQDITQATQWALQLPAGSAQEAAVSSITSNWARLDPVAASEWVQQLPPGGSRDTAAQQLSQSIQTSDPESAFVWASSIGNVARREETVRNVVGMWIWHDRIAARAAIEHAPVSETTRASLLEQLSKRD